MREFFPQPFVNNIETIVGEILRRNNAALWENWESIKKMMREKETEQARKEAL